MRGVLLGCTRLDERQLELVASGGGPGRDAFILGAPFHSE